MMSKRNLQIEEETFKVILKAKSLIYNATTPPRLLAEQKAEF